MSYNYPEDVKTNYGYYVCSDDLLDFWMINGLLHPTADKCVDKSRCYRFEIDNNYFCYPSHWGIIARKNYDYCISQTSSKISR